MKGFEPLAALFIAFGSGAYFAALNYPQEQRHQPYRYAADKPAEIDPAAALPDPQSLEYRTPCEHPKGKDESDLCAQWKAANAAEDSALWTKLGFWVGLGGLVGLFFTLYYTRKAVIAAEDATKDADRALDIAAKSAEAGLLSAKNIAAQRRPLLTFTEPAVAYGDFEGHPGSCILYLYGAIKNIGEGPAFPRSFRLEASIAAPEKMISACERYAFDRPLLMSGETTGESDPWIAFGGSQDEVYRYAHPTERCEFFYLRATMTYRDVYGTVRKTGCLFLHVLDRKTGKKAFRPIGDHRYWYDTEIEGDEDLPEPNRI